jgi:hypothetical protein
VPFGGGDHFVGKQAVKPGQHPPGRAEMAIVDAPRLDIVMLAVER